MKIQVGRKEQNHPFVLTAEMRNTWQNGGIIVRGKQAVSTKALTVVTLSQLLHTVNWFGALCDLKMVSSSFSSSNFIEFLKKPFP